MPTRHCFNILFIQNCHLNFITKNRDNINIVNARNLGVILAITVKSSSEETYFNYLRDKLYNHFIDNHILLRPLGNVIYVMPPYCFTMENLELVYDSILGLLEEL